MPRDIEGCIDLCVHRISGLSAQNYSTSLLDKGSIGVLGREREREREIDIHIFIHICIYRDLTRPHPKWWFI